MSESKIDQIHNIDSEELQSFLTTRESATIPPELQEYILRLNQTASIIHHAGATMLNVIKALKKEYPDLTQRQAVTLYYDTLNFFYIDDTVSVDAWDNYYADQFENLSRLAIASDDLGAAVKSMKAAHELRTRSRDRIKPEDWQAPVFIISDKIRPEDLGYAKQSVYDVARRNEDGVYKQIITSLPAPEKEKKRLMREAGIVEDARYEEINPDEDAAE